MPTNREIHAAITQDADFWDDWDAVPDDKKLGPSGRNVVLRAAKRAFGVNVTFAESDRGAVAKAVFNGTVPAYPANSNLGITANTCKEQKPVKFLETITYLNGTDISKVDVNAAFTMISAKEAEVERLEKLANKPKLVVDQIAKIKDEIAEAVAALDAANAKKADTPAA